jgi:hypothetical protein
MAKFKKGKSGNPKGKPKGARNKSTIAAEALLDGDAEAITRKAIEKAKDGDIAAIRLCLERILPAVKSRPISIELPKVETISDVVAAQSAVIAAMANGELRPDDGAAITTIITAFRATLEAGDLEDRIQALEKATAPK